MSKTYGIEELRGAVLLFEGNNESFNMKFTAGQLLQLYRMHQKSAWDLFPDQWHPAQVLAALDGHPPDWDKNEEPILLPSYAARIDAAAENGEPYFGEAWANAQG